ncbi:aminotransferase class III-fold pyridoxal phosphate-dependent enzyme [Pseudomonas sp. TUM22785]|uniref:aminotransferase class III-fold pyridoxal phosphate-dependent enzyme n=1 Tax=Pseudomonas sp. TUM22785 TaxID=3019098 RepID=UPI00230553CA|nr:aminotransferase class III-fold pyridoxal phosphate-dependent enzyme [Pseudomonas sp. TUM22785]WCD78253.1 aminotransferase class III-fold pyridoxal phosphate-dependent enzyme [Pseudomonas sp. TUM22785]
MRPVSNRLHAGPPHAADNPSVTGNHAGDVRGVGLLGAIERVANKATGQALAQPDVLGGYLFKQAHKHGLIIRAIYDTIAFCPPLITTQDDLDAIFSAFDRALADATDWARSQNHL